jgi:hypothetical protein
VDQKERQAIIALVQAEARPAERCIHELHPEACLHCNTHGIVEDAPSRFVPGQQDWGDHFEYTGYMALLPKGRR